MPTNRTRRRRRWQNELDCYRIEILMNGSNAVPLPGTGYLPSSGRGKADTPEQQTEALEEMRRDWAFHRERLLQWWITGENAPQGMKPWTFVMAGRPGTRPWAWWEFDAPEPLGEHESERDYLQYLNLFLPGEEQLPTPEDRDAAQQAAIQARIDANLRNVRRELGRSTLMRRHVHDLTTSD